MIKKELFECRRDDLTIRGTIFRAETEQEENAQVQTEGKKPVIILSHGFMGNEDLMKGYAEKAAEWGYCAFTYDFCGGCAKGRSDGRQQDMSVLTEVEDLKAVIRFASSLTYTDENDITLMGSSQGGFVSGLTAAQLGGQIKKLIMFYPALCIPDDARKGKMMMAKFNPDKVPEVMNCGPFMKLGREYPMSVMKMDAVGEIGKYTGPVLIVHGTNDKVVNVTYAKQAFMKFQSQREGNQPRKDVQLVIIEKAGHGFTQKEDGVAIEAVKQFLEGFSPILAVDVFLTAKKIRNRHGADFTLTLPFTGVSGSPYFSGRILSEAADVQQWVNGKAVNCCADYFVEGEDYTGQKCTVHITNRMSPDGVWKPEVSTDSKALEWLSLAECRAVLEHRRQGPVVRIYAR